MSIVKRSMSLVVAMLVLVTMLSGCGQSNQQAFPAQNSAGDNKPIKIGAVYPLTGAVASIGQNIKRGIDFAAEEINAKGGIKGKKIEIVYGDSQGDPKLGMSETERLITKENVAALIGAYQSGVTEVVSQVAERNKTPLLTAISTADALTTRGYQYFFRLCPTNMTYLRDMIQYTIDVDQKYNYGLKKIAILADNTLLGQETAKWAKYWADKKGLNVVETVLYTRDASDLSSEVVKLKAAKPDVLVVDSYISDAILLTKTINEQGFKPKVIIAKATGMIDPTYIPNVKELSENITTVVEWNEGMGKGLDINKAFKAKYNVAMNGHSAEAYTGLWVLKTAIEQAGGTDRDKIREALSKINIQKSFPNGPEIILPYDSIKFDASAELGGNKHTNTNTAAQVGIAQIRGGQYKTVWPFNLAEVEPIVPYSK